MSDPTEPTTTTEAETIAPPEGAAEPKVFDAEYVSKLRAEAAKYRTEAKANADAAKKLADIEEANKSELQKALDRAESAEREALAAKRDAFAASKGVLPSMVSGSTPEEWESSAAQALAWKGDPPKLPAAPSSAGQGNNGIPVTAGTKQLTKADMQNMTPQQIDAAFTAGQFDDVLSGKST